MLSPYIENWVEKSLLFFFLFLSEKLPIMSPKYAPFFMSLLICESGEITTLRIFNKLRELLHTHLEGCIKVLVIIVGQKKGNSELKKKQENHLTRLPLPLPNKLTSLLKLFSPFYLQLQFCFCFQSILYQTLKNCYLPIYLFIHHWLLVLVQAEAKS